MLNVLEDFPGPIREQLCHLCVEARKPAYLLVGKDGLLKDSGGFWDRYGVESLRSGEPAVNQLALLEGLFPLDESHLMLPMVQTVPDVYADVHCFAVKEGNWVLFLDATATAYRLYEIQQNANELALLRRDQNRLIAQIQSSRRDMMAILNQLRLVTAIIDSGGSIQFLSDAGQRLFACEAEKTVGVSWEKLFPFQPEDLKQVKRQLTMPVERRSRLRVRLRNATGRHFSFEVEVQDHPRDPEGSKVLYFYDVTEVHDLRRMLQKKASFHDLVGRSKPMELVFQTIRDVSAVDSTVLIEGETGTGKELVAAAIHAASLRKDKAFIVVNCAGLSDSLINSQLFGHKKGSFTDAVSDQEGLFEAANHGTIFLDEIGDIPANTQTRILRALEQKEITRVGETRSRKVDVRILAATNKDLNQEVAQGRFRLDLLYRIRVARVTLPPLWERAEDIPLLVQHFLEQARAVTGKTVEEVDTSAMRKLMDYRWPGNVRELKNAIEFGVIRCRGRVLGEKDLPPELLDSGTEASPHRGYDSEEERTRILEALRQAKGKRSEAAKILGIGRATLYRRMKACLLDPDTL